MLKYRARNKILKLRTLDAECSCRISFKIGKKFNEKSDILEGLRWKAVW